VDVVRYVHRFPAHPDPHVSYGAAVDCQRGPEEGSSTFALAVPTKEEAARDALRIVAQKLLGQKELDRIHALVLEDNAANHHALVVAVRTLLWGDD
jgi:hypothetical protein